MSKENEGIAATAKRELDQFKVGLKMFAFGFLAYSIATALGSALAGVKAIGFIFLTIRMFGVFGMIGGGITGIFSGAAYLTSIRKDEHGFLAILIGAALSLTYVFLIKGKGVEIRIDGFTEQSFSFWALTGFGVIGYYSYHLARGCITSLTKSYLTASMGVAFLMSVIYADSEFSTTPDFFYRYLTLVAIAYGGIFFGNTQRDKRY
ncbi:MAG: hypothetical protein WCK93_12690 [Nitrosomonadales bacterium]